jgi:hypothetical protein
MADSWLQQLQKRFESTFHPSHMAAGVCKSYTLTQVRDLLAHGASITDRAKSTGAFARYADVLGPGGEKLADAAERLDDYAQKGATAVGDVKGACEVAEAIVVLDKWVLPNGAVSNQDAAKAFDKLFGGAAHFFEKLPPPINAYASILSGVAEFNFFSRMQDIMHPESPNTPKGRALREVMESMDR